MKDQSNLAEKTQLRSALKDLIKKAKPNRGASLIYLIYLIVALIIYVPKNLDQSFLKHGRYARLI